MDKVYKPVVSVGLFEIGIFWVEDNAPPVLSMRVDFFYVVVFIVFASKFASIIKTQDLVCLLLLFCSQIASSFSVFIFDSPPLIYYDPREIKNTICPYSPQFL